MFKFVPVITLSATMASIVLLVVMLYRSHLCDTYGAMNSLKSDYSTECLVEVRKGVWMSRVKHEALTMALVARGRK